MAASISRVNSEQDQSSSEQVDPSNESLVPLNPVGASTPMRDNDESTNVNDPMSQCQP